MGAIEVFARLLLDDKEFQSKFRDADGSMTEFGRRTKQLGGDLTKVGIGMTAGLTLPILGFGAAALHASGEFDAAFLGVQQNVSGTSAELARVEEAVKNLGKTGKGSASDLAILSAALGEVGVAGAAMPMFLEASQDFAEATGQSLERAGLGLQSFLKRAGLMPEMAAGVANAVVALGNAFSVAEGPLLALADAALPTAEALGIQENAVLALGASFLRAGGDAETGGRVFSQLFTSMAEAAAGGTEQAAQRMQAFADAAGMSIEQFRALMETDAVAATKAFLEGIQRVKDAGGPVVGILDQLGLSGARMRDGVLLAAAGVGSLDLALATTNEALGTTTALQEESAKWADSQAASNEALKDSLNAVAIEAGQALVPALQAFAQAAVPVIGAIGKLIGWFNELPGPVKAGVIAFVGLLALAGPLIGFVGTMITMGAALSIAWLPLTLTVLAVAAAVAALIAVGYYLAKNWEDLAWWSKALAVALFPMVAIPVLIAKEWDTVKAVFGRVLDWFKGLPAAFDGFGQDIVNGLWDGVKAVWQRFADWFEGKWDGLKDKFKAVFQIGSPSRLFEQYGQWVVEGFRDGLGDLDADATLQPFQAVADAGQGAPAGEASASGSASWTVGSITYAPVLNYHPTEAQQDELFEGLLRRMKTARARE